MWALRRGSLFHKNEVRPSYMQTLVLKKQLREHFADLQQDARTTNYDSAIAEELLRQEQLAWQADIAGMKKVSSCQELQSSAYV